MMRSIVVGTDGSDTAGKAVEEAIALAKAFGASIELVSASQAALAEAAAAVQESGVPVRTWAREGDAADAILDVAEERGADLIVVYNEGMAGAKRFMLGTVPNKVSHHAPCSVLIVRTS